MTEYQPVPVDAARQIGQHFGKGIVVILAVDDAHALIHCTTWGETAEQKHSAAQLGDQISVFVGMDLSRRSTFEDFRTRSEADSAATIDRLIRERDDLRRQLENR